MSTRVTADPEAVTRTLALLPRRAWINVSYGPGFITVAFQRRIEWPPAIPQTRHYWLMLSRVHGVIFGRSDV